MEELYNKALLNSGQKILIKLKIHKTFLIIELICVHLPLKENGLKSLKQSKINKRLNKRKLKEIKSEDVPQLLKVFDF